MLPITKTALQLHTPSRHTIHMLLAPALASRLKALPQPLLCRNWAKPTQITFCSSRCSTSPMASSDEEESPAMQFTRSVRRVASSRQAASPTDSENSTPGALPAVKAPLGINNTPQSAASGYVQRQPRILFSSPISPSSSSKGANSPQQPARPHAQPLRAQQATHNASSNSSSGAWTTPRSQQHSTQPGRLGGRQQLQHELQADAAGGSSSSPSTPAAGRLPQQPLDLNDPYTPWLRTTARKARAHAGREGYTYTQGAGSGSGSSPRVAGGAATNSARVHALSYTPVSISSGSSSSSSAQSSPSRGVGGTAPEDALSSLCAAVADLQLKQGLAQTCAAAGGGSSNSSGGHAAADNSASSAAADAVGVASPSSPQQWHQQQEGEDACTPPAAAARGASSPHAVNSSSGSDDDDDAAPLTLGRRTQPRVYRRPMFALVSDSDSDAGSSSNASGSDSESGGGVGAVSSRAAAGGHSCGDHGAHRRVTPGSTSSLVARRRTTSINSSNSKGSHRPRDPSDTGYTGAYDFDAHLSTIKPPRWQIHQQQQQQSYRSSPFSVSPRSPVAALSFATPVTGTGTAAGGSHGLIGSSSGGVRRPGAAAAVAVTPLGGGGAGGFGLHGAARRLSQTFLGGGGVGGPLLSPPVLKGQLQQQQQQGMMYSTPAGGSAAAAAGGGRRGAQTALPARKTAAGAGVDGSDEGFVGRTGRQQQQQGFGGKTEMWQPLPEDADGPSSSSAAGAGDLGTPLVPSSRRRPKKQQQQAGGAATAPAKAPSSRMWARTRQALSQQLYEQWNTLVFDGALPSDLPIVWNPRLTATAGQVVDDGSKNCLKSCREQRIPVRLELSSKVLDCEARLRTTLSHEMCHVAAWVITKEWREHHGAAFWAWARRFEKAVPGIKITTCHNFDVHAPFRWQCSNHSCGKLYVRHKRSIDTVKHVCSRCQGRLLYLGKFNRDGRLIASSVSEAAAAGGGAATPGGRGGGGGGSNAFTLFVKSHFADLKRSLPTGTPHKEVMTRLAAQYKEQKQKVAAAGAAAATPAGGPQRTAVVDTATATTETVVAAAVTETTSGITSTKTAVMQVVAAAAITTTTLAAAVTPAASRRPAGKAAAVASVGGAADVSPIALSPEGGGSAGAAVVGGGGAGGCIDSGDGGEESIVIVDSDDEGWQTADEELEDQTSSLLNFMDRLALS